MAEESKEPKTHFEKFRASLERNKVFMEVLSFLIVGLAGIYVSYNSAKVSATELQIHKVELLPEFKVQLIEKIDSPKIRYWIKELRIEKTNGYARDVNCEVFSYITFEEIHKDTGSTSIVAKMKVRVDYYSVNENQLGRKGYISCYSFDDIERLYTKKGIVIGLYNDLAYPYVSDTGKINCMVYFDSFAKLNYTNILNERDSIYYAVDNGGNMIYEKEFTDFTKDCINPDSAYFMMDMTPENLSSILKTQKNKTVSRSYNL